jgi:hypothetical protein
VAVSFIGGGNQSTRRKPPTCRKLLNKFLCHMHNVVSVHLAMNGVQTHKFSQFKWELCGCHISIRHVFKELVPLFTYRILHDFFLAQLHPHFKWNFSWNLTCLLITYTQCDIRILLFQFDRTLFERVIGLFHLKYFIQNVCTRNSSHILNRISADLFMLIYDHTQIRISLRRIEPNQWYNG